LTEQRGQALVADEFEDAERLSQMVRSFRRRQRRRRAWALAAVGATVVIGILGAAALVRTHIATPSAQWRSFVDKDARASIPSGAEVSKSATIAQSTPRNTGPPNTTVQQDHQKGPPASVAPDRKSVV
jgi:hypothetical protein